MALGSVLALLSLVSALLLLAQALPFRHGSSRLLGPGSALTDLLLAAVARLDSVSLLDLATRRNMVLLGHAILLVLLGDAGLLSTPARRRRRGQSAGRTGPRQPLVDGAIGRPESQQRGGSFRLVVAAVATEHEHDDEQAAEHVATKEIVVVEREQGTCLDGGHLVAGAPAATTDCKITVITDPTTDFGRASVADGDERSGTEDTVKEAADEQREEKEDLDLDEMNRRFEAFIAETKAKMRLEAMQPSGENRALVANTAS